MKLCCWIQWMTTWKIRNSRFLTTPKRIVLSRTENSVGTRQLTQLKPVCCFSKAKNDETKPCTPFFPRCWSYTRFHKLDDEQLLRLRDEEQRTWSEISTEMGRSISSCLSRYQLLKSKEPTNLHFTREEDLKLKQLVTQGLSWVEIAKQLNKPFPYVCKRRYEDTLKNENRRGEFTEEEDSKIVELVQKYGAKWNLIAQELGTRTAHQCLLRYERVLRPFLKKGAFREEEDILLLKLFEKYGPQWSKIEKEMSWRSSVQIRKRYYTLEDQAKRNKNPWTREEEEKLIALFEKYGRKWTEIAKEMGNRTASQCMYQLSECMERGELEKILSWTRERDQELKEWVELYGNHWIYISRRMKYFSPRQCEERWIQMTCVNNSGGGS
ncbi:Myb-like DNA-binding protein BAS1 [Galdieria sulphuraria]|uniref:Myb-like DNA-binding protein BAS1 n=1 Tax=Galdieria sulphuraria TaxID=130081 RepID=M2XRA2_GALSU|nr:Myb-like DNA-binding protein BAS1 [Galdieria sulphuraria]EME32772.1 Myb-like DNA-binding protein BAS1 [Galdieria sulphuraria]|eukprot:XP_005709292.1 Myb-like DNA-binding protein BAS1 [Galdieria sulphuraria]